MPVPQSTQSVCTPCGHRPSAWTRRVLLLGAVALSLAFVGNPAAARTPGSAGSGGAGWLADTGSHGLTLAVGAYGTIHRSVSSWSDATTEAVSLALLGLGLIGTSRWLGRERRERRVLLARAALQPAEAEALRPRDTGTAPAGQRAVC